jgi:hypothetical protein
MNSMTFPLQDERKTSVLKRQYPRQTPDGKVNKEPIL